MTRQIIPPFVCQERSKETDTSICFREVDQMCWICKKAFCKIHYKDHELNHVLNKEP